MTGRAMQSVRDAFGTDAVSTDAMGLPRLAPPSTEVLASALALAHAQRWRVRVEGRGSWARTDAPCDIVVTTAALDGIVTLAPRDLVATVRAGTAFGAVRQALAAERVWLAWDPPGTAERSLGSIVASGTAGPLRHRFGPVRDHLLGCTLVTGDGRVLRPGGTVVKNVAGYDLSKLVAGGFGAFGVVTELHLRLRALPAADRTFVASGARDLLTSVARDFNAARLEAAALELLSPAVAGSSDWSLTLRLMGTDDGVAAEVDRARRTGPLDWRPLDPGAADELWNQVARAAVGGPVTIRLGVLMTGLDDALDLVTEHLPHGHVTAGAGSGAIRWTGDAGWEALETVRGIAAGREIPLTLERGPWALRERLGHFGRYRDGVGRLVTRLRETFDPGQVLQVPLEARADG